MRMNKDDTNDDSLHNAFSSSAFANIYIPDEGPYYYPKEQHFVTLFLIHNGEALLMQAN